MQKILVARPIFPDVIERLQQYFDVDWNQGDVLPAEELKRRLADIPGEIPGPDALVALMGQDKKVRDGRIAFVLARDIGAAFVARDVSLAAVRALLAEALASRAA